MFLATKFEAFDNRGQGDLLASHDMEDIVNVIASRARIVEEVRTSATDLRQYLAVRCRQLLEQPDLEGYLPGLLLDTSKFGTYRSGDVPAAGDGVIGLTRWGNSAGNEITEPRFPK
jgi:hypothetical protein